MYGHAMQCDMCATVEMIPAMDDIPESWIRIDIHQPADYRWNREEGPFSLLTDGFDCCSLMCAREVLSLAADMVPKEQDA